MKRITILMLLTVFALAVVVTPGADAGWFKKDREKRTEKPEWMKKPQRYEAPVMSFHSGVLQQDGWSGWKLGEVKIHFTKDCLISTDGAEEGYLDAGREAIVMGPRFGDTILAWSVRVVKPDFAQQRRTGPDTQLQYSEANPDCGEVIKAPR